MFDGITKSLEDALEQSPIPNYMHEGILAYVLHGRPTGDFLRAVLTNNLKKAVDHGDDANRRVLPDYVMLLYNYAPQACWGSEDNVKHWIEHRGLELLYPKEGS